MKSLLAKFSLLAAITVLLAQPIYASNSGERDLLPTPKKSYLVKSVKEFDKAVKRVQPGDEIILASGNWSDVQLKFDADGTAENMIYLRGEEPSTTIIDGDSQLYIGGDYLYVYNLSFRGCVADSRTELKHVVQFQIDENDMANHSILSDCYMELVDADDKLFDDVWVSLFGTYNTVQYCYMGGKHSKGLYVVAWHEGELQDFHTIKHNYFYRPETVNNGTNGQECVRIGHSWSSLTDSSCIVEDNFFYRCNGEVEVISIKSGDNIIRRNTFLECQGALTLRHGEYNTVESNYFLANGVEQAGGVRIINKGQRVYNNYFYKHVSRGTRAPISIQCGVENGAINSYNQVEDADILNNTFVDCSQVFSFCVTGKNTTLDPTNVTISGVLCIAPDMTLEQIVDNNGRDDSGITFYNSHIEASDGVRSGEGFITAEYSRTTMNIAGLEVPKIAASTTMLRPTGVTTDISAAHRSTQTPIGAIASSEATPAATVATPENCGPRWNGWKRPL